MKKWGIILIGLLTCLSLSACGSGSTSASKNDEKAVEDEQQSGDEEEKEDTEKTESETEQEETSESEDGDDETIYNIGDSASLKDWEISVTDMQIVESISAKYGSFSPKESGNKYIQVFVTVVNNGKQAERFLPMVGMGDDINAKVFFGDGYEFSATNLLGYENELHDSTLNPLSSKTGEIVFTVPEAVSASEDELLIHFISGKDTLKFKIR